MAEAPTTSPQAFSYRRDRERYVHLAPSLGPKNGLERGHGAPLANGLQEPSHFFAAARRSENGYALADDLLGGVPKQFFGSAVPTDDGAIQIHGVNGVVRAFHDRGQQSPASLRLVALRDIAQDVFAQADAFVLRDRLALLYALDEIRQKGQPVGRHQNGSVLSDHVRGGIAEYRFRAAVPGEDGAGGREREDGVAGTLDDRSQERLRFLRRSPDAHVPLDRYVVGNLAAGILDRRDLHLLGVERAVLPPVDDLALPDPAASDGIPEILVERRRLKPGFEDARLPAHGFLAGVSRQCGEGGIHVLNCPVGRGDDDAFRGLFDSRGQAGAIYDADFLPQGSPRRGCDLLSFYRLDRRIPVGRRGAQRPPGKAVRSLAG